MGRTSLKNVLKKFLIHFEDLERLKKTSPDEDVYHREFHSLKELTESLKTDQYYACSEGLKDVNRKKNRYKDILPYNHTRVVISEYPGVPGSDYINANYVKGSTGSQCAYIASQGPLPNTVVDFWRMIWECEVTLIIMACNERESGKYKCESYWPLQSGVELAEQYGNITVELVKWRQVCPDFLVRTLKIAQDGCERTVCQFHYTTWPDHGVPPHVLPILELIRLMRDVQATEARPILVHCSAGCGRTGTICSIDYVWALLRAGKLSEDFCLYSIIRELRRQRIAMVQTYEQYVLCYRAVAALFEQQLKIIDAHTYENLDEDGQPLLFRSVDDDTRTSSSSGAESGEERSSSNSDKSVKSDVSVPRLMGARSEKMISRADASTSSTSAAAASNQLPSHLSVYSDASLIQPQLQQQQLQQSQHQLQQSQHQLQQSPESIIHDPKQEKLVGKATVIRRPSIAKLKAMFENIQIPSPDHPVETSRLVPATNPLQRSHSTKERNHPLAALHGHASCSSDYSIVMRNHAAVVNEVQSIYGTRSNPNSSQEQVNSSVPNQQQQQPSSTNPTPTYSQQQQQRDRASSTSTTREEAIYGQLPQRFSYNDGQQYTAPPKPPRTYQYLVNGEPQVGVYSSNVGRVIALTSSSSSPKKDVDARIMPPSQRNYQRHISTPNLAAALPTFSLPNHPTNLSTMMTAVRSSDTDLTRVMHQQQLNNLSAAAAEQHLQSIKQQQINHEPIYQPFIRRTNLAANVIYEPIGLKKQQPPYPFANVNMMNGQKRMIPSNKVAPHVQRRPTAMMQQRPMSTHEGIYGTVSQANVNRPPIVPGHARPRGVAPLVTYVRPQANPNRIQIKPNDSGPVAVDSRGKYDQNAALKANSTDSSGAARVQQQLTAGTATGSNGAEKVLKGFSEALPQDKSSSAKGQADSKNKNSFSLPFFGRSKQKQSKQKKQEKEKPNSQQASTVQHHPTVVSTSQVNGTIRPPHSHRFSPPAQWTQV